MIKFIFKNKKWFLYTLYCVALTGVLLYFYFPSDVLTNYIQSRANNVNANLSFSIERAKPWLPLGLRLWQMEVSTKKRPGVKLFSADSTIVRPDILSFFKGQGKYMFKSFAYGGAIEGFVVTDTHRLFDGKIEFDNINVGAHKDLKELLGRHIDGVLRGYVNFRGSNKDIMDGDGEANLELLDGSLEMAFPVLLMEAIDFNTVIIDMHLKDRKVDFKQFEFKGSLFKGTINGSLRINKKFSRSIIDLKGTVELFSGFFKNNNAGLEIIGFLKNKLNKGKISFAIYGTIGAPKYKLI